MSTDLTPILHASAKAYIAKFNGTWTPALATDLHAPSCTYIALPSSLKIPVRNNAELEEHLTQIQGVITNCQMTLHDLVVSAADRRVVCRVSSTATTPVGPYANENVFFLTFSEDGREVTEVVDFMDSMAVKGLQQRLLQAKMVGVDGK